MIALQDLRRKISSKLDSASLPPKVLQSRFKTGFDKPVLLFNDPTYLPFYYQLGRFLKGSKNLIEFGFDLGMPSGCFIDGCSGVQNFVAFRKKREDFYAKRLGVSNIHNILKKRFDLWIGDETDPEFIKMVLLNKWDCVIISDSGQNEKTIRAYLDLVWNQTMHEGIIVVDFLNESPVKQAYESFCKLQNREAFTITTLRGTGFLQR